MNSKAHHRYKVALAHEAVQLQINQKKIAKLEASIINRDQLAEDMRNLKVQMRKHWESFPIAATSELSVRWKIDSTRVREVLQYHVDKYLAELDAQEVGEHRE